MQKFNSKRGWTTLCALFILSLPLLLVGAASGQSQAASIDLRGATSFGALDFTAMTNSGGLTVVNGDIGSSTSIDASITNGNYGAKYLPGSTKLTNANAGLLQAYGDATAATPNHPTITGVNLAGKTEHAGVYNSSSTILISGPVPLTLDGDGNPGAVFIFQAGSDMTVDPTSSVRLTNGAQACNVFWKVNSAFLKNSGENFVGSILALTQITLTNNIRVSGRVLARNADVTFIHDSVIIPFCSSGGGAQPNRELYCDPSGKSYNLLVGQDKDPPYDTLGLVPATVDPVTGAKSCVAPVVAATTTTTTTTATTTTTPTATTPTPVTPKPAPKPKPKVGVAAAKKTKAVKRTKVKAAVHTPAKPAQHAFGFTG